MNRLAEEIVPFGLRIAWRRASCPTSRSPFSVNATTDGVVRVPSALGMTSAWPPSQAAITELVVPRSMPTALAMGHTSRPSSRAASAATSSSTTRSKRWACIIVTEAKSRLPRWKA